MAGALPDDLSLNSTTGVISGIPVTVQTATFTVQVKDSSATPQIITQQLTLAIVPGPLSIATSLLPAASVNQPYQVTLATGGGAIPFVWPLASGTLPPGLALINNGQITGTATTTGLFNFTVRVQDATLATATRSPTDVTSTRSTRTGRQTAILRAGCRSGRGRGRSAGC